MSKRNNEIQDVYEDGHRALMAIEGSGHFPVSGRGHGKAVSRDTKYICFDMRIFWRDLRRIK